MLEVILIIMSCALMVMLYFMHKVLRDLENALDDQSEILMDVSGLIEDIIKSKKEEEK